MDKEKKIVLIMACGILGVSFIYLFLVTFCPIPQSGTDHAKTITGFILGVGLTTLVTYFFGSSSASAAKSATIEKQLNGQDHPEPISGFRPPIRETFEAPRIPTTLDELMKGG